VSTRRSGRKPAPSRPKEAPRPEVRATSLSVLPAGFVRLSPADAEAAIEALASLLARFVTAEVRAGEPDETMR